MIYEEKIISLAEAAKRHYPRPCSPSTAYRHAVRGNRYGIHLETIMSGGRRVTSAEAVERFIKRTTKAANERLAASGRNNAKARVAAAAAQLDAILTAKTNG